MFQKERIFSSYAVDDLEKARTFYQEVLNIPVSKNDMGILELHISKGNRVIIYPKPNFRPADFTVLNIPVDNIDLAVDELSRHGVNFEHYKDPIKTDKKGIHRNEKHGPAIAWFKDPAGNILSVIEE